MTVTTRSETLFRMKTGFTPAGDQPAAIEALVDGILKGERHQTLLGVTGSGKTFTVANVIQITGRPALVIAPNKTLAAQLYSEFKDLFPDNAVEYFVSYYDYYQPEAYVPASDTYIEKDAAINDEIDKLRHSATHSLLTRSDVIIVASVSCIYGIGSPEDYGAMQLYVEAGMRTDRAAVLNKLVEIRYERNDYDFHRGAFRVRGDIVDVFPAYESEAALRFEFFGDVLESITEIDPLRGKTIRRLQKALIHPASHYVTTRDNVKRAMDTVREELRERLAALKAENKLVEAQRLESRTLMDMEMLEEMGYCPGIENYSRHITGRPQGEPPYSLLDYFPKNFLLFIDESHITVPQLGAMYSGDKSRKETLISYGFRLPSALDNRPLKFEEFERRIPQAVYVSATPAAYERKMSRDRIVEQVIRPTGLMDPAIEVRPATAQVDDLLGEIKRRAKKDERTLVTTLTKRLAEDLTRYYGELGIRVKYLHSDVVTLERIEIIREFRLGGFDALIGINLLREGLDLPEVSLVAILDADKEGFLRSETSLIQTCGRAARNVAGCVIMYADAITRSMRAAIDETERRRRLQSEYNKANGITPESVKSRIKEVISTVYEADYYTVPTAQEKQANYVPAHEIPALIKSLRKEMEKASKKMDYEKAASLRDRIRELEDTEIGVRP
ncbi:MAG: excinuclease ABC subunit UvrB [Deltaproteobacteria bacterium]